jgi:hypothetical protein
MGSGKTFGNLGRMKLMLESAHEIVENDPMFRIRHAADEPVQFWPKSSLGVGHL